MERRNRSRLASEIDMISGVLTSKGPPLCVFPEATSSNGEQVLPFKGALFDSAARTGAPLIPICIHYEKANGAPISKELRDSVFYYGEMTFGEHFLRFCRLRSLDVTVEVLDPIVSAPGASRKELAERAYRAIVSAYTKPALHSQA